MIPAAEETILTRKFKGGQPAPDAICNAREGVVIFDTVSGSRITVGAWKPTDGEVTNISWWDFIKAEKEARTRRQISYEIRYDKKRKRVSITGLNPGASIK